MDGISVKNVLMMDLFLINTVFGFRSLTRLLVDHCDVFISCLESHFDGTHSHPLVRQ